MKPVTDKHVEAKQAVDLPWQVVVMNDPVNLMSYVVMAFRRVFGYDGERAKQHMLEVHRDGSSILWSGEREQAESYVYQLHEWQLAARLQQDAQD